MKTANVLKLTEEGMKEVKVQLTGIRIPTLDEVKKLPGLIISKSDRNAEYWTTTVRDGGYLGIVGPGFDTSYGSHPKNYQAVCPVVTFEENPDLKPYDRFMYGHPGNDRWTVIPGGMAMLDNVIIGQAGTIMMVQYRICHLEKDKGMTAFASDGSVIEPEDLYSYEKSDLKKFLDEWAKKYLNFDI